MFFLANIDDLNESNMLTYDKNQFKICVKNDYQWEKKSSDPNNHIVADNIEASLRPFHSARS